MTRSMLLSNQRYRFALAALAGLLVVLLARTSWAHGGRTTWITVDVLSETDARLTMPLPLTLVASEGCAIDPPPNPVRMLRCRDGIAGASFSVDFRSSESPDTTLVRMIERDGSVLTARSPVFTFPSSTSGGAASRTSIAARFVRLGFEHVLSGLDHVLFMVALFWQAWIASKDRTNVARGRAVLGELLRTATAFTVAHSLSLAATILGWVRVPTSVAEACIAASLVLVALDMDARDANETQTRGANDTRRAAGRERTVLAFAFGLVHGLGFAGALEATRIPEHAVALGLLSFNVGVELGQLLVFLTATLLFLVFGRRTEPTARAHRVALVAVAYGVGTTGVAMFLTRVASLLRA